MALTPAERLVRRDRVIVGAGLCGLAAVAWAWTLSGAGIGMSALDMTRTGLFPHLAASPGPMAMRPPPPGGAAGGLVLAVAMWWIMMIAMMLPAAAPAMLLFARTCRHARRKGRMKDGPVATSAFLAGYLSVWLAFSIAAALVQQGLVALGSLSGMMLWSQSRWLSAGLLALAAANQLTPAKRACLAHCQGPAEWLARNWRQGHAGAFRMGAGHGAYCLGCCWSLMLLLFVGGVMNLLWIAALAGLVLVEKLAVPGFRGGRLAGAVLGLWAAATLLV